MSFIIKDNKKLLYNPINPKKELTNIVLADEILDSLEDAIAFCKNKTHIIEKWMLSDYFGSGAIALNFFGLPGTGKTITAEAFAKALNYTFLEVDYSEIAGNLFGDTEKNLTKLFEFAESNQCVIFLDEADALLSKRANSVANNNQSNNQIKSHLLTLLDRKNTILILATNQFQNYDRAFLRRILFHIEFSLPNTEQRERIWQLHFSNQLPKDCSFKDLAIISEKLSGGDIKNIALRLIIKLNSGKIDSVTISITKKEIQKYNRSLNIHSSNNNSIHLQNIKK